VDGAKDFPLEPLLSIQQEDWATHANIGEAEIRYKTGGFNGKITSKYGSFS